MKTIYRMILPSALVLFLMSTSHPALSQGAGAAGAVLSPARDVVEVSKTNWVSRVVTNLTDLWMTTNIFVTEHRTNWIQRVVTNVVQVQKTTWLTQTLTNLVPVELWQTNQVTAFQTNRRTLTLTNWETVLVVQTNVVQQPVTNVVEVFNTNVVTWTLTKGVPVEMVQTNLVLAYHTNWRTLSLTNWETVLVMQTNWVRQPATNVVEIQMVAKPPVESETPARKTTPAESAPASTTVENASDYTLEMARTGKRLPGGQAEVVLQLKPAIDPSASLEVQSWRVERADKAILLFGQGPEFRPNLPAGTYDLEMKVRRDAGSPFSTLRATIAVTPDGVTLQKPLTLVKRTT